MSLLRVANLYTHNIGPVSFMIEAKQCVCISGASGSGKTLLLRAIADLDEHRGQIYLNEIACEATPPAIWRQQVGMLLADSQWWCDTVGEHFTQVDNQWLAIVGFDNSVLNWPVSRLSMGERQRLAIVRLLGNHPKILLLDEPTANLDAENTQRVEKLIAYYQQATQAALVCVTHNFDQIQRLANYHYQLQDNSFVASELP